MLLPPLEGSGFPPIANERILFMKKAAAKWQQLFFFQNLMLDIVVSA